MYLFIWLSMRSARNNRIRSQSLNGTKVNNNNNNIVFLTKYKFLFTFNVDSLHYYCRSSLSPALMMMIRIRIRMMMRDNPNVLFVCSIHLFKPTLRMIGRNAKIAGNIRGANESEVRKINFLIKHTNTQFALVAEATGNTSK